MSLSDDLLIADFSQCFEHMRHYDDNFSRTLEFGFAGVVVVVTAAAALVGQYGFARPVALAVGVLLLVSGFAGLLLVVSLARNRVYFATVARYVNEIRASYLVDSPGGVKNAAGIYSDYRFPTLFNPLSSHTIQVYFLAFCNSLLFAGAVAFLIALGNESIDVLALLSGRVGVGSFLISLAGQISWVLAYWSRNEKKFDPEKKELVEGATRK